MGLAESHCRARVLLGVQYAHVGVVCGMVPVPDADARQRLQCVGLALRRFGIAFHLRLLDMRLLLRVLFVVDFVASAISMSLRRVDWCRAGQLLRAIALLELQHEAAAL